MVKKRGEEYIYTGSQIAELFLTLSQARFKCTGTYKTSAQKQWEDLEKVLGLKVELKEDEDGKDMC